MFKAGSITPSYPRLGLSKMLALLLAIALIAAACGGSGDDSSAADSSAADTSGEPILVMVEAPVDSQVLPFPNIPETARLYAEWINAQGGIKGRPLQILVCDDKADAGEAAACARTAVAEKVVANVGGFTLDVGQGIEIYEENDVAWFGECCPIRDQEFNSPNSFPLGFVNAFPTAAAIRMVEDGCTDIVGIFGDDASNVPQIAAWENGFRSIGSDPAIARNVLIPLTPGDYSAQAAQVGEADCVFGQVGQANWPSILTSFEGVGIQPRLYGPQGNLDETIVAQFPEATEGALVIGVYPNLTSPVWDDFRYAIETYDADPDLNYNSLAGLGTWTAFTAFTLVVEAMEGEINNATFLKAASQTTSLDTSGMIGVVDFTTEYEGGGGAIRRIFNRSVFYDVVTDGVLVPVDGVAYDMSDAYDGIGK